MNELGVREEFGRELARLRNIQIYVNEVVARFAVEDPDICVRPESPGQVRHIEPQIWPFPEPRVLFTRRDGHDPPATLGVLNGSVEDG
jgi:hypothetical protein